MATCFDKKINFFMPNGIHTYVIACISLFVHLKKGQTNVFSYFFYTVPVKDEHPFYLCVCVCLRVCVCVFTAIRYVNLDWLFYFS